MGLRRSATLNAGQRSLTSSIRWFRCGADGWEITPTGTRGVINNAIAVYYPRARPSSRSSLARKPLRQSLGD